jgi:hypothetical protein
MAEMSVAAPVLHGREAPLGALLAALESALAARGRLAVVSGEAGIGKSALSAAVAREAEDRGIAITWGRAWEFGLLAIVLALGRTRSEGETVEPGASESPSKVTGPPVHPPRAGAAKERARLGTAEANDQALNPPKSMFGPREDCDEI